LCGVHGPSRTATSTPVSTIGVTTATTATRRQTPRHQCAAKAATRSATPRYQYTSSFVLSQIHAWNTTTLHSAKIRSPATALSTPRVGNAAVSGLANAPTCPRRRRAAATSGTTSASGTAIHVLASQNPHHDPLASCAIPCPPATNTLPKDMVSSPAG